MFTLDTNERKGSYRRDLMESIYCCYVWIGASSELVEHEKEFSKHCKANDNNVLKQWDRKRKLLTTHLRTFTASLSRVCKCWTLLFLKNHAALRVPNGPTTQIICKLTSFWLMNCPNMTIWFLIIMATFHFHGVCVYIRHTFLCKLWHPCFDPHYYFIPMLDQMLVTPPFCVCYVRVEWQTLDGISSNFNHNKILYKVTFHVNKYGQDEVK